MKKLGMVGILILLFWTVALTSSQSTAILEIVPNGEGTLIAHWVATPTVQVVTATLGSTQTPWIITATVIEPTQEVFTPTPTSTPTNTPDPLCLVQNQTEGRIRVRNLPSTVGTETVGFIENGEYLHPEAYYVGPTYTWYKIFWDEVIYVWTAADFYTYISGDCEGLLYENPF